MAASPDGRRIALATHDGRLLTCNVPSGEISRTVSPKEIDSTVGDMSGLAFSPDSRWLAWSSSGPGPWEDPGPRPLRQIKVADLDRGRVIPVTSLRFTDTNPVFTLDGKHLAFLSIRSLDPMYDTFSFDLSFPAACRPHLVALATTTPSPFDPVVGGRPLGAVRAGAGGAGSRGRDRRRSRRRQPASAAAGDPEPPRTTIDTDGLEHRVVAVPVEAGRYSTWPPSKHGLVWLREPLRGELGDNRADVEAEPEQARVEHFDLRTSTLTTVVDKADRLEVSGDGSRVLVVAPGQARRSTRATSRHPRRRRRGSDRPGRRVDLDRIRVEVDPPAEWRQMLDESWRLMRDHFWREDMGGARLGRGPQTATSRCSIGSAPATTWST